jgi:hypothetical protein
MIFSSETGIPSSIQLNCFVWVCNVVFALQDMYETF